MSLPPGADLSKIPLAPNPNGAPPNFVDPPSLFPVLLGLGITLVVISLGFVTIRIYTNLRLAHKLFLDDYLCIAAELFLIVYWIVIASLGTVAGRHTWDVPLSIIDESFIQRSFVQTLIIGPTLWCSKAAVLALYIRLFGVDKWLRYTAYTLLITTGLIYWAFVPLTGVFCSPRQGVPPLQALAQCTSIAWQAPMQGAVSVLTDVIIFILPLPTVRRLQLGSRKRLGLMLVFMMGFFAIVAGVVSLVYRVQVFIGNDAIWNATRNVITAITEGFVTVIVSCAPALSAFWSHVFTKSALYSSLRSTQLLPRKSTSDDSSHRAATGSKEHIWPRHKDGSWEGKTVCTECGGPTPKNSFVPLSLGSMGNSRPDGSIARLTSITQSTEKTFVDN